MAVAAAFDSGMWRERSTEYKNLGWVGNAALLQAFIHLGEFKGNETAIDNGTGTGAVLKTIAPYVAKVIGVDISQDMLNKMEDVPANAELRVGDALNLQLESGIANVVTARMIFHHLPDIATATRESMRVLKPRGKLIVSEYAPIDDEALALERVVFDHKEPGRNLWTGEQLSDVLMAADASIVHTALRTVMMPGYSVDDWINNSGIQPVSRRNAIREAIKHEYRSATPSLKRRMNIREHGEDVLVDRLFANVVAHKE